MKQCYMCDYCGRVFDKEFEAKKCEASHEKNLEIIDADYKSDGKMPYRLVVASESGRQEVYYKE